jgi:hypothetical protein
LGFDYAENADIADNYIFDRGRIAVPFCKRRFAIAAACMLFYATLPPRKWA